MLLRDRVSSFSLQGLQSLEAIGYRVSHIHTTPTCWGCHTAGQTNSSHRFYDILTPVTAETVHCLRHRSPKTVSFSLVPKRQVCDSTDSSNSVRPLVSLIAAHNVFLSPNKTKIIGITTEIFFHPWRTYPMCALTRAFPSSEHEYSIAQPKTDKWLSSPSHFSSSTVPKS